ncbi:MAG: ABC-2 family transporter protein [Acidobacteria bacterium]|nr:ABC-2 family transporter protein [Acidobacteriota bacterium]
MKTLHKFAAELRAAWYLAIEYRITVLLWAVVTVLPLIMLAAWLSIAEGGPVGRFGRAEFIAYYMAALLVRNLTGVWVIWELDWDIRHGHLSFKLLKPMNPIFHYMALSWGSKPIRAGFLLPFLAAVLIYIPGNQFSLDPLTVILFAISIIGAWFLLFSVQYIIGLLAFWITQSLSLHDVWFAIFSLFSGYLIPIELFPPLLGDLVHASPFRYMLSFSAEIITGQLTFAQTLEGFAFQGIWCAAFFLTYRIVWVRGLKHYSAVGA